MGSSRIPHPVPPPVPKMNTPSIPEREASPAPMSRHSRTQLQVRTSELHMTFLLVMGWRLHIPLIDSRLHTLAELRSICERGRVSRVPRIFTGMSTLDLGLVAYGADPVPYICRRCQREASAARLVMHISPVSGSERLRSAPYPIEPSGYSAE